MANVLIFLMKFLGMDFFFFFFLQHSEFMVGVINLENDDSLTWKLSLYYHNNHFYLFLLFVIFSVSSTVTMQIDVLLLKQSLPDVFRSSSSYFILISWKFSDIVYSPATINKHPLVSVMNFHGVWGKRKKEDPHSICLNISRCPICYWKPVEK